MRRSLRFAAFALVSLAALVACDPTPLPQDTDASAVDAEQPRHPDLALPTPDAGTKPDTAPLEGDVAEPQPDGSPADFARPDGTPHVEARLALVPLSSAFGEVIVGTQSSAIAFVIKNTGNGSSGPLAVTTSDRAFRVANDGCGTALALAPEQSCTVTVTFVPDALGPKVGTLDVRAGVLRTSAALSGTGIAPATLSFTPYQRNFGDVGVGAQSAPAEFTLRNEGNVTAPMPNLTISEGWAISTSGCAASAMLAPLASCKVNVVFSPTSLGTKSGVLKATIANNEAVATLTGRGVPHGMAMLLPAALDFGAATVGGAGVPRTVKLVNTGGTPLTDVRVGVGNATDFVAHAKCPTSLDGGTSCDIDIIFKPTTSGARSATLFATHASGAARTSLSGSGLEPAKL